MTEHLAPWYSGMKFERIDNGGFRASMGLNELCSVVVVLILGPESSMDGICPTTPIADGRTPLSIESRVR